ncbi:MAG TPA: Gfo/Idh/MocA family oxidoreductase [Candidatus Omnitrophica bacterium]|nr:Gfo/Idh/MocA family oxidoreductase [Candidatus Omnitrophota bacterium]
MSTFRVGIIGTGGNGNGHLVRISKMEGVEIAALCDIDKRKVEECATKYGGRAYTNHEEMLDKESLDALFISIPPFAHTNQELLAAEKNIPFLVEKPVALSLEKAKEVERKIKERNLVTSVGYQLRYMDIVQEAKKLVEKEKIALTIGQYFGEVPGGTRVNNWLIKRGLSGGQVVEQATHIIDLMRFFVGEIKRVDARYFKGLISNRAPHYEVEDASSSLLEFENGVVGSLSCTWLMKGFNVGLQMIGDGLNINICSFGSLVVERTDEKKQYEAKNDPQYDQDRAFLEAVKMNDPSLILSDYSNGLRTLAVTMAISESAEKMKPIEVNY